MPLSSNYTTPSTGAEATYHVVTQVSLDYIQNNSVASVASYLDNAAFVAGKFSMYQQQINLDGLPAAAQDAKAYAEAELIIPAPANFVSPPFANRYAFAGAAIVA